jgi:hypothetical protein
VCEGWVLVACTVSEAAPRTDGPAAAAAQTPGTTTRRRRRLLAPRPPSSAPRSNSYQQGRHGVFLTVSLSGAMLSGDSLYYSSRRNSHYLCCIQEICFGQQVARPATSTPDELASAPLLRRASISSETERTASAAGPSKSSASRELLVSACACRRRSASWLSWHRRGVHTLVYTP